MIQQTTEGRRLLFFVFAVLRERDAALCDRGVPAAHRAWLNVGWLASYEAAVKDRGRHRRGLFRRRRRPFRPLCCCWVASSSLWEPSLLLDD